LLLLAKGYIVTTGPQLDNILERGAFVDVEEIRAVTQAVAPSQAPTVAAPPNLFDLWNQTSEILRVLLNPPQRPPDILAQLDAFAARLVVLVDYNANIAIYRAVRQENAHNFYYGYTHSVHTAVLCILWAGPRAA